MYGGEYEDVKQYILQLFNSVPDDFKISFWRDLNNGVTPIIIEAEKKRTKPFMIYDPNKDYIYDR